VSEELSNHEAPTSAMQDSTQEGSITLQDINFSINGNIRLDIHLAVDPALQAALERMAEVLKPEQPKYTSFDPGPDGMEPLLEEDEAKLQEVQRIIEEANRKSEKIELAKRARIEAEKNEKYGHIVFGGDDYRRDWNRISERPNLRWKTAGEVLHCSYGSAVTETSWDEVERLSKLSRNERQVAIRKIVGNNPSANKRSSITLFVRLFVEGKIKRPESPEEELEKNFARFQLEEDPDAAFRPMLTSYSTRPDENSGKVEGDLEVEL